MNPKRKSQTLDAAGRDWVGRGAVAASGRGPCRSAKSCPQAGFTLVELMIVIVIIGIAAAMAIPMMSSAASFQIRAGANMVAADLEYAKSMAISRGQNYSVIFDVANDSYQIEDQAGNLLQHPFKKGVGDYYVVDFRNNSRVDRVDITEADFDGVAKITFDYLGSPSSNSGTVKLQADDAEKWITVEPVTGYISVEDTN